MKAFRFVLALLAGYVLGSTVNMMLILISSSIIPPPPGADVTSSAGLKASMHLFGVQHFIFPFVAHALGTLIGAWIAATVAPSKNFLIAMVASGLFLLGGISSVIMLPSPLWFTLVDLIAAYLPMGLLGWILAGKKK